VAPGDRCRIIRRRDLSGWQEANLSYRLGKFQQALATYEQIFRHKQHPIIVFNMGQCHREIANTLLHDPQKRLHHITRALFFYRLHLSQWKKENPSKPSPYKQDVDKQLQELQQQQAALIQELKPKPRPAEQPKPTAQPTDQPPKRSTLWLASGITTAALAAAALGVGIGMYEQTGNEIHGSDAWHQASDISLAMYVTAGVLAAASAASWFLYWYSGRPKAGDSGTALLSSPHSGFSAGLSPVPGGVITGAQFVF